MTAWEYLVLVDLTREELDTFGREGWELVAAVRIGDGPVRLPMPGGRPMETEGHTELYLKRPLN